MFNIGAGEMVFILVAALLILGPQRLPELARAIGKFMREFRRQTDEVRSVVEREFYTMDQDFQRELPRSPPPTSVPASPTPALTSSAGLPAPSEAHALGLPPELASQPPVGALAEEPSPSLSPPSGASSRDDAKPS